MGGVARARAFAKKLNDAPLAIVDKRRSAHNISEVMNLIGDVKDKVAVLVDDMIDTAGALPAARCPKHCPLPFALTAAWRMSRAHYMYVVQLLPALALFLHCCFPDYRMI